MPKAAKKTAKKSAAKKPAKKSARKVVAKKDEQRSGEEGLREEGGAQRTW